MKSMSVGAGEGASAGTFEETAKFGDLLVPATLGTAAEEAITMAGADNFRGKVLIDATNPLGFSGGVPPRRKRWSARSAKISAGA